MKALDRPSLLALAKLTIFMVVTTLATSVLVVTIGNLSFADKTEYHAIFTDATAVTDGDDVRIAGVRVGSVTGIEIHDRDWPRCRSRWTPRWRSPRAPRRRSAIAT